MLPTNACRSGVVISSVCFIPPHRAHYAKSATTNKLRQRKWIKKEIDKKDSTSLGTVLSDLVSLKMLSTGATWEKGKQQQTFS